MKSKKKTYEVCFKVTLETSLPIQASSYEEALTAARELGVKDLVQFDTPFNDGSCAISCIFADEEPHK